MPRNEQIKKVMVATTGRLILRKVNLFVIMLLQEQSCSILKEFEIALSSSVTSRTTNDKAMENVSTVPTFVNTETTGEQIINLYMNMFVYLGVVKHGSS